MNRSRGNSDLIYGSPNGSFESEKIQLVEDMCNADWDINDIGATFFAFGDENESNVKKTKKIIEETYWNQEENEVEI